MTRFVGAVSPGDFADVTIESVEDDYDFSAALVKVADRYRVPVRPAALGRVLPVATTAGSFGR